MSYYFVYVFNSMILSFFYDLTIGVIAPALAFLGALLADLLDPIAEGLLVGLLVRVAFRLGTGVSPRFGVGSRLRFGIDAFVFFVFVIRHAPGFADPSEKRSVTGHASPEPGEAGLEFPVGRARREVVANEITEVDCIGRPGVI